MHIIRNPYRHNILHLQWLDLELELSPKLLMQMHRHRMILEWNAFIDVFIVNYIFGEQRIIQ